MKKNKCNTPNVKNKWTYNNNQKWSQYKEQQEKNGHYITSAAAGGASLTIVLYFSAVPPRSQIFEQEKDYPHKKKQLNFLTLCCSLLLS